MERPGVSLALEILPMVSLVASVFFSLSPHNQICLGYQQTSTMNSQIRHWNSDSWVPKGVGDSWWYHGWRAYVSLALTWSLLPVLLGPGPSPETPSSPSDAHPGPQSSTLGAHTQGKGVTWEGQYCSVELLSLRVLSRVLIGV